MSDVSLSSLTHRRMLAMAWPIVVSNATVPLLGVVDTGVVGQLGLAAPIGAVGIGAIILSAIYWIFGFLRMGTAGLTAQALGARDQVEASALLVRVLGIAGIAGILMIILQVPLFWGAFRLAPASAEVETLAWQYLSIRIYSAPAAVAIYGITGWMIATERARPILVLQVAMNGLNMVLDVAFVMGLDWGVAGVAVATVIAEYAGLLLGLWLLRDAFAGTGWRSRRVLLDRVRLWRMAQVNTDIMIRSVLLQAGFVSFLFLGSSFGDATLAANQVLIQFIYVTSYTMDGFTFAAEALVGQTIGARDRAALRRSVFLSLFWGGVTVALLALCFGLFGPWIIAAMTTAPEVRVEAARYLPWVVAAPLAGVLAWMMDGIFIGATQSRDMRNMMLVSTLIYGVALAIFLPLWDNHGLWLAMTIFFAVRGLTLLLRYPALEALANAPPDQPSGQ